MKILCIGDSITHGSVGSSFVELLQQKLPGTTIVNRGKNGDTIIGITTRLFRELALNADYDYIILQGGYNDILLPGFKDKGYLFRFALKQQLNKGLLPIMDAVHFKSHLEKTVIGLCGVYNGKIIMTSMGCINEDLSSPLNAKRNAFNDAIRQVATEQDVLFADPGQCFDSVLANVQQTNYCLESFLAVTITDPALSQSLNGPERLSKKRNLQLTIDGVHLNRRGADLFAAQIFEAISTPA